MFSNADLEQIKKKGISIEEIENQINTFKKGVTPIKLYRNIIEDEDITELHMLSEEKIDPLAKLVSFIPASGAATRMFNNLYKTLDEINEVGEDNFVLEENNDPQSTYTFLKNIRKFAFYDLLKKEIENDGLSIGDLFKNKKIKTILEYILNENHLNYGSKPKALIVFHKEKDRMKCAFEEHISEAINYSAGKNIYLHYTLSPEYINEFNTAANEVKNYYEKNFDKIIHIETSVQSPKTDTIAVNPDNTLFRNPDHSLLFRPGGHGALIHNLNNLDADFILIKNIDNVVPDSKKNIIIKSRLKMLNYFIDMISVRNSCLYSILEAQKKKKKINLKKLEATVEIFFRMFLPENYSYLDYHEKLESLREIYDRPMRMCAMVKNEGEPGGGPFVVYDNETLSMQIVERSQIDSNNPEQVKIFDESDYFNPVDIICHPRDCFGNKYNLEKYVDHEAAFISNKTKDGKPLKALELPGLWNGAMSNWITIFVEVPIQTFNPVKIVNDLLRPAHR